MLYLLRKTCNTLWTTLIIIQHVTENRALLPFNRSTIITYSSPSFCNIWNKKKERLCYAKPKGSFVQIIQKKEEKHFITHKICMVYLIFNLYISVLVVFVLYFKWGSFHRRLQLRKPRHYTFFLWERIYPEYSN